MFAITSIVISALCLFSGWWLLSLLRQRHAHDSSSRMSDGLVGQARGVVQTSSRERAEAMCGRASPTESKDRLASAQASLNKAASLMNGGHEANTAH